jgi:hypothetical protein
MNIELLMLNEGASRTAALYLMTLRWSHDWTFYSDVISAAIRVEQAFVFSLSLSLSLSLSFSLFFSFSLSLPLSPPFSLLLTKCDFSLIWSNF